MMRKVFKTKKFMFKALIGLVCLVFICTGAGKTQAGEYNSQYNSNQLCEKIFCPLDSAVMDIIHYAKGAQNKRDAENFMLTLDSYRELDNAVGSFSSAYENLLPGRRLTVKDNWSSFAVHIGELLREDPFIAKQIYIIAAGNTSIKDPNRQRVCLMEGIMRWAPSQRPSTKMLAAISKKSAAVFSLIGPIAYRISGHDFNAKEFNCPADKSVMLRLVKAILNNDANSIHQLYKEVVRPFKDVVNAKPEVIKKLKGDYYTLWLGIMLTTNKCQCLNKY